MHAHTKQSERWWTSSILRTITLLVGLVLLGLVAGVGCGESGDEALAGDDSARATANNGGGAGVGQSGAQDFGRFRSIVESGEVPAPNTLDAVGFFNEHKFELPAPDCGENVCMHGLYGVWGNMLNGANCTLAMLGFNTPLNPDDYERPPLNMAIAVDVSGSMSGEPIRAVRIGLSRMVERLQPKDTVTLVTYSTKARVALVSSPEEDPDRAKLLAEVDALTASGGTNIYDGLRTALNAIDASSTAERQNRVILLSDGVATEGIQNRDRIINLGESYADEGIGVTTIGVGTEFDIELMQKLSESGAGNFYFIEDLNTVEEVFVNEAETFLIPVAEEVTIEFDVAKGYRFRAAYGTRTWEGDAQSATITIPALFIASRESIDDIDPGGGRRGGGGAILLEVVPTSDQREIAEVGANEPIGTATMTYTLPGGDETKTVNTTIVNPLAPGETPNDGEFESKMVEKAFVTLNLYVGMRMATQRAAAGAPLEALGILQPLRDNVVEWEQEFDDPDIESDLETLNQLIDTLDERTEQQQQQRPVPEPPNPWPND